MPSSRIPVSRNSRVAADEGAVRSSSAAMNASTCSRWMLRAAVGMPWRARNATKSAPSSV